MNLNKIIIAKSKNVINENDINEIRLHFQHYFIIFIDYACIGRFSSDGQYYRALVTAVNHEEGVADLVYVDYGTKEAVPIERYCLILRYCCSFLTIQSGPEKG